MRSTGGNTGFAFGVVTLKLGALCYEIRPLQICKSLAANVIDHRFK
jgi:hypothetical protein